MNPVTTGRKADAGTRVGAEKVLKITSVADSGRIRIVKWSGSMDQGLLDREGRHKFDVTLADGRSGYLDVDLDQLPKKADYCVGAFVKVEGKCEYLPLRKLALANDLSEVVIDLVERRCFALLSGCVCNPVFRGFLKACRSLIAVPRLNLISPACIAVLESGIDTIKYLEKKDYGSIATLFRMSACEPLPSICEAMAASMADLRKAVSTMARVTTDSFVRSQAITIVASARDFSKSVASIGKSMTVIRESLGPDVEDRMLRSKSDQI